MSVQLVFETHSISTDNENRIATGWLHGRLSPRGRELARELGRRRRNDGVDAVFASDLGRAVETAELAFRESGIQVFLDWRLRECDYGELNGAPVARLDEERAAHIEQPFPGGESCGQVSVRVGSFLRDVARDWHGRRIVVIGHSATRWALDQLLNGTPLEELVAAPFAWREGWLYELPTVPENLA